MPQLNVLPVDVSLSSDYKTENTTGEQKQSNNNGEFSAIVEQHIEAKNKDKETKNSKEVTDKSGKNLSELTDDSKTEQLDNSAESHIEVNQEEKEQKTAASEQAKTAVIAENGAGLAVSDGQNNLDEALNFQQSEQFFSLLDSANKILQTSSTVSSNAVSSTAVSSTEASLSQQANSMPKVLTNSIDQQIYNEQLSAQTNKQVQTQLTGADLAAGLLTGDDKLTAQVAKNKSLLSNDVDQKADPTIEAKLKVQLGKTLTSGDLAQNEQQKIAAQQTKTTTSEINQTPLSDSALLVKKVSNDNSDANLNKATQLLAEKNKVATELSSANLTNTQVKTDEQAKSNLLNAVDDNLFSNNEANDKNSSAFNRLKENEAITAKINNQNLQPIMNEKINAEQAQIDAQLNSQLNSQPIVNSSGQVASNLNKSDVLVAQNAFNAAEAQSDAIASNKLTSSEQEQSNASKNNQQSAQQLVQQAEQFALESEMLASNDDNSNELTIGNTSANPVNNANQSQFVNVVGQATETFQALEAARSVEEMAEVFSNNNQQLNKIKTETLDATISIFRKDFADAVKEKVMVMISQKLQQFDIRLDPPELGNVHVRVNLQGEQAVVNFIVQNQQAKEAFEQNLDKLKEMLAEKGVDVGESSVEQQNQNSSADNESQQQSTNNSQSLSSLSDNNALEKGIESQLSTRLFETSPTSVDFYA